MTNGEGTALLPRVRLSFCSSSRVLNVRTGQRNTRLSRAAAASVVTRRTPALLAVCGENEHIGGGGSTLLDWTILDRAD